MDYTYLAYTRDKKLVRGKLSATSDEAATKLLSYGGYQVLTLKPHVPFFNMEKIADIFTSVKPREIIMFSRQLALLLESGTDIVASLELLQAQVTNRALKKVIGQVASDIRGGSSLSSTLKDYPQIFPEMYSRAIAAGERSGNLEVVLRQMADFLERRVTTGKKVKSALTYPIIIAIVAILVVGLLVTFVLPTFTSLYAGFGVDLPPATEMLISATDWLGNYGIYLVLVLAAVAAAGFLYIKTPNGKYQWHKILLRLPVFGRIVLLGELSRSCRTMSLLFRVGLPLPEVLSMAITGSSNKAMAEALTGVQKGLIRGEGLSKPMSKSPLFLPLMVQMVSVGEETGNLDNTLNTVA
ncbi:MAG: type II secretion system F family protein, partial [Dehalococcoidales bacterium]